MRSMKKDKRGVTLLEMTVSIGIFSVIMLSAVSIFNSVLEGQRSAFASQNIQEGLRYAFEVMSKEARTALKDASCSFDGGNAVYSTNAGGNELYFKNVDGDCVIYFPEVDGNGITRLKISRGANQDYITPKEIDIKNLKFNAINGPQQWVTIKIEAEAVGKEMHKQNITLQTSVASRYYEE